MAQIIELIPKAHERAGFSACPSEQTGIGLGDVYVIFTSIDETLRAVRVARRLARAMRSGVTIVHFRPIGFGAPLEEPAGLSPVETDAFKARLEAEDCDARIRVCVCRDARQAIPSVLQEHSLIVIGGRRRWWPTPSDRWRRTLEGQGYLVVLVDETLA
jgi:hypothetical protein